MFIDVYSSLLKLSSNGSLLTYLVPFLWTFNNNWIFPKLCSCPQYLKITYRLSYSLMKIRKWERAGYSALDGPTQKKFKWYILLQADIRNSLWRLGVGPPVFFKTIRVPPKRMEWALSGHVPTKCRFTGLWWQLLVRPPTSRQSIRSGTSCSLI